MENPYKSINELKTGKITTAQKVLFDGLIKLWKTKPIYKISVKELTEVSNVARSTFYVYYKNIDELIEDIENYHLSKMMHLNEELMNTEIKSDVYLSYYQETINYVKKNKDVFYALRKLDILQDLLEDDSITEIMTNGCEHIFIERNGKLYEYPGRFSSEEKLYQVIQQVAAGANRMVNEMNPILDARLEDGSRVNIILPPVSLDGAVMTIRKFAREPMTYGMAV